MKVRVRMQSRPDGATETRHVTLQATDYPDAYEAALDCLPEGWVIVRVEVLDGRVGRRAFGPTSRRGAS